MTGLHKVAKLAGYLLLAASLQAIIACSQDSVDERVLLERARAYLEQQDLNAATIELKNTLRGNPDNGEARYLLGMINLDLGDYATAEKEFRRAGAAGWSEAESRIGLARTLLGQRDFRKLLGELKIEESYPAAVRAELLALRALAEDAAGEPEKAAASLAEARRLDADALQVLKTAILLQHASEQAAVVREMLATALSRYPDDRELLLMSAGLAVQEHDNEAATALFRKVIEGDPAGYVTMYGMHARLGLARMQILAQETGEAEQLLLPLYRRNANDPSVNYLGGLLAFTAGDHDLAEERLLKVLKVSPEHNPTRLLAGVVNFAQGDYEQAAYFLEKYLAVAPDNADARKLLGRTYLLLGQYDSASETFQASLDETDDTELLALTALSDLHRGQTSAGIAGLEKAIAVSPARQGMALRRKLASVYLTEGETGTAIRQLQELLAEDGEQKQTQALLVLAHLENGEFDRAVSLALEMLSSAPQDPVALSLAGSVFTASGNREEARNYLNRALTAAPDYIPALITLARIEEVSGNPAQAAALYERSIAAGMKSPVPYMALARLAGASGDGAGKLKWLLQARESFPMEVDSRVNLADHYLREQRPEKARELLDEVVALAPEQADVLLIKARVLMAEQQHEAALEPLTKLLDRHADSALAHAMLGECLARVGRNDDAYRHAALSLEAKPDYVPALVLSARLETQSGKYQQALDHSLRIQKQVPDLYLGYMLEGNVYLQQDVAEKAVAAYQRAWGLERTSELVIRLADASLRSGEMEAAAGYLTAWLDEHPDDVAARHSLALAYLRMEAPAKAVEQYERLLVTDPQNLMALNNLANLYLQDNGVRALEYAKRAYSLSPSDPRINDTYGWILVQQGQASTGLGMLKQAMEQLPNVAEVRYHYAVALYDSGEQGEARRILVTLLNQKENFDGRENAQALIDGKGLHD